MIEKAEQFMLLTKHPPLYSYIQSSPVKVLAVIEEKNIFLKEKDPLSFEIWMFRNGFQISNQFRIMTSFGFQF